MASLRGGGAIALAFAACLAGGCTSLGDRIAQPHSTGLIDSSVLAQMESTAGVESGRFRTSDGVTLAYRVVAPAARGMTYTISRANGSMQTAFRFGETKGALPVAGTVVFLHGWTLDASSMLPWALAMSELGYQGIVVDLRNHGGSSRAPAGFGTREAHDIAALVEHLQAEAQLPPPLYLFGVSYGAATALFAEPLLRERITGTVAMESYANAGDGVRGVIAGMQAGRDSSLRASLMRTYARWRYDAPAIERGVREAGQKLGLDLDAIDVRATLATTATCTLVLHGADDSYVPAVSARALADASPLVRHRELPDENHLSLPLRIDWLARPIAGWMKLAAGGECDPLRLPPDPLADGGPSQFAVGDADKLVVVPHDGHPASPDGAPAPPPSPDATAHEFPIPR